MSGKPEKDDGWDVAFAIVAWMIWIPLSYLWSGFVLMKIWNWFIPRAIPVVPSLDMAAAVGIVILWGMLMFGLSTRLGTAMKEDETHTGFAARTAMTRLSGYGFMLGIAWIAQLLAF